MVGAVSALRPRIVLYFTPTSGSWLNLAEVFWTKTADGILPHATGVKRTSITRH